MAEDPPSVEDFWKSWMDFLSENWQWFVPLVATFTSPLIASGMSILYDWLKTKEMI